MNENTLVLVTGGTGYVGIYCVLHLLNAGYRVRTTVRSLQRADDVRAMLKTGGVEAGDRLSFVAADLLSDAGWADAVAGCDYVLHVASPFPQQQPKNEDDLIIPAREGALRVLRAARDAGVKRVVLTSSFAAISSGHTKGDHTFTEKDWSNVNAPLVPYNKSKTLAERAAWDFVNKEGGTLELSVVNPVGIAGPVLGPDLSTSVALIKRLMEGALPSLPNTYFNLVDVRDVADLHLLAMTHPAAKGERFVAVGDGEIQSVPQVAAYLKSRMGDAANKIPTGTMPNWLIRAFALINPEAAQTAHDLGNIRRTSNSKAKSMLGWKPGAQLDSAVASAESLVRLGLVNN